MQFRETFNVAIHLRDGDETVTSKVAALEGTMLAALPVLAFDDTAADAYRQIVEAAGNSRRKLLERMIAAEPSTQVCISIKWRKSPASTRTGIEYFKSTTG